MYIKAEYRYYFSFTLEIEVTHKENAPTTLEEQINSYS